MSNQIDLKPFLGLPLPTRPLAMPALVSLSLSFFYPFLSRGLGLPRKGLLVFVLHPVVADLSLGVKPAVVT